MADVKDILARMSAAAGEDKSPGTTQAQNPIWAPQPSLSHSKSYHQPSVSSPIFSPQPTGPQPAHSSAVMSPNMPGSSATTPQLEAGRSSNLLNLLRWAPGQKSSRSSSAYFNQQIDQGQPTSIDQAATFASKPPLPSMLSRPEMKGESTSANADDPQQALLRLLNPRASPQSRTVSGFGGRTERILSEDQAVGAAPNDTVQEAQEMIAGVAGLESGTDTVRRVAESEGAPMRIFGHSEPENPSTLRNSIFNYVNPFDELSASSPQNRTPRPDHQKDALGSRAGLVNQDADASSATPVNQGLPTSLPLPQSRKFSPGVLGEPRSRETSSRSDKRTPLEALMDISAEAAQQEPKSQALKEVVKTVDAQVKEAIPELSDDPQGPAQHENEKVLKSEKGLQDLVDEVQDVAKDIQEELKKDHAKKDFEKSMPTEVAKAVEDTVQDIVQGVPEDWEDMEESNITDSRRVFTFPMRPFHAIDIQSTQIATPGLRENGIMDIARFKKDFDQLDRNLATATKSFIAYAALKHGGFRLIHQGSGKDKHLFRGPSNADRVFNIAVCSGSAPSMHVDIDAIIATGLDGSVYWTAVNRSLGDNFDEKDLNKEGFILPPLPGTDDNTSGAQLKTRAKPSSRHTEYFAIGRGKSIHIVWPYTIRTKDYTDVKTRVADSKKFFDKNELVISTGKAAKDFAFSEDDTVIVTLDKSGRIKFWDIHEVVDSPSGVPSPPRGPVKIRIPKVTFATTPTNEKSWPTSIMFIDKERPYLKSGAVRYLVVGFKQNHTLQLWDLGLKKAVQEINLPHENETDPICSLGYHPRTGVLAVGHPTRNSIYLIHVSCPKYNLSNMSQARFIQRLATQDPPLPTPETTAIKSGVPAHYFAAKGQLRSLSIQDQPITENGEDEAMFELYVMHSKGVTCLTVAKSDIGWNKENKNINAVDGGKEGFIVVRDLQLPPSAAPSEPSINGDSLAPISVTKKSSKGSRASETATPELSGGAAAAVRPSDKQLTREVTSANGTDRIDKKSAPSSLKRTEAEAQAVSPTPATPEPRSRQDNSTAPSTGAFEPLDSEKTKSEMAHDQVKDGSDGILNDAPTANVVQGMVKDFATNVNEQLEALHRRLDDDRRVQDAAGQARHEAVLRLVSSSLTENVDKSLNRIISANIKDSLLPTISDTTIKTLDRKLPQLISDHIRNHLPKDIKAALPGAISTAVQSPNVIRSISDNLTEKITKHVERQLQTSLTQSVIPAFNRVATQETQKVAAQLEARVGEQLNQAELNRTQDLQKIEEISTLVRGLSETVQTIANTQATFQNEYLKLHKQLIQQQQTPQKPIGSERSLGTASHAATEPEVEHKQTQQQSERTLSEEDEEIRQITQLLHDGYYEGGTIKVHFTHKCFPLPPFFLTPTSPQWLQSERQSALFNRLFYRVNPPYLTRLSSPLVALSCAAAVSQDFSTHIPERLNWLDAALNAMDFYQDQTRAAFDADVREVTPNIMNVLIERLQELYVRLSQDDQGLIVAPNVEDVVRKIAILVRRAGEMKEIVGLGMGAAR